MSDGNAVLLSTLTTKIITNTELVCNDCGEYIYPGEPAFVLPDESDGSRQVFCATCNDWSVVSDPKTKEEHK